MKVKHHYSIDLDFELNNTSSYLKRKQYIFDQNNRNYISEATFSISPKDGQTFIKNIPRQNVIKFNNGSASCVIAEGNYSLPDLLSYINDSFIAAGSVNTLSVITSGESFGKAELFNHGYIDFAQAPDVRDIFKFDEIYLNDGVHIGNEVTDITKGLQNIRVFCSLLNASSARIANQSNEFLCSLNIESTTECHTQQIKYLTVPVFPLVNSVHILFKDEYDNDINMSADVHITLHINSYENDKIDTTSQTAAKDKAQTLTQLTNLSFVITQPNEVISLPSTVELPDNTYIERISVLFDGTIANITKEQRVLIDGHQIIIKPGSYELYDLLAELNVLENVMFTVVLDGEAAFHTEIEGFVYIDFSDAKELANILGIAQTRIDTQSIVKKYRLTEENNTVCIGTSSSDYEVKKIPTGTYSYEEFINKVSETISSISPVTHLTWYDKSIQFVTNNNNLHFIRSAQENTIQNYQWTRWFNMNPDCKNLYLARADTSIDRLIDNAFIPETYIHYDYEINTTETVYVVSYNITYQIWKADGTESVYLEDFRLGYGEYTYSTMLDNVVNELNKAYQKLNGLTGSESNAIAFTAETDEYNSYINFTQYAPTARIKVTTDGTNDWFSDQTGQAGSRLTSQKVYARFTRTGKFYLPQDANLSIKRNDTDESKTITIPPGEYGIEDIADIFDSILKQLFGNTTTWTAAATLVKRVQFGKLLESAPSITINTDVINLKEFNNVTRGASGRLSVYSDFTAKLPKLTNKEEIYQFTKDKGMWLIDRWNKEGLMKYYIRFYVNRPTRVRFCSPTDHLVDIIPDIIGKIIKNFQSPHTYHSESFFIGDNLGKNQVAVANAGFTYSPSVGDPITFNLQNGNQTQHEYIMNINTKSAENNCPVHFTMAENYYSFVGPLAKLENYYLDAEFFGPKNPSTSIESYAHTIPYNDGAVYTISGELIHRSDNLINLTYNKDLLNFYFDKIEGVNDTMLVSMEITDLHKNFLSKRLYVPIKKSFNKVKFALNDALGNPYSFTGNIFINLSLATL